MSLFDLQIDFFVPLWRRVVLVAVCIGWALFEFATGAPFWGMVFGGMGCLAVWQFFFDDWPARRAANGSARHEPTDDDPDPGA